jgi:hypothetical protein
MRYYDIKGTLTSKLGRKESDFEVQLVFAIESGHHGMIELSIKSNSTQRYEYDEILR